MKKYRIIFKRGEYHLQTSPCTSSAWDTQATGMFRWTLHLRVALTALYDRWYHRNDGYIREWGEDDHGTDCDCSVCCPN